MVTEHTLRIEERAKMRSCIDVLNLLSEGIQREVDDEAKKRIQAGIDDLHFILEAVPKDIMEGILQNLNAITEDAEPNPWQGEL